MYLKKSLADVETVVEISWVYNGSFGYKISNFTLFWCENDDKDYSPYQCTVCKYTTAVIYLTSV